MEPQEHPTRYKETKDTTQGAGKIKENTNLTRAKCKYHAFSLKRSFSAWNVSTHSNHSSEESVHNRWTYIIIREGGKIPRFLPKVRVYKNETGFVI